MFENNDASLLSTYEQCTEYLFEERVRCPRPPPFPSTPAHGVHPVPRPRPFDRRLSPPLAQLWQAAASGSPTTHPMTRQ